MHQQQRRPVTIHSRCARVDKSFMMASRPFGVCHAGGAHAARGLQRGLQISQNALAPQRRCLDSMPLRTVEQQYSMRESRGWCIRASRCISNRAGHPRRLFRVVPRPASDRCCTAQRTSTSDSGANSMSYHCELTESVQSAFLASRWPDGSRSHAMLAGMHTLWVTDRPASSACCSQMIFCA